MIIFAWADPVNIRLANDFIKARREPHAAAAPAVCVDLYSTPDAAPPMIAARLVRVQVRADWVGEDK